MDPLSPYIFVLCMEVLGHYFQNAVDKGNWKGIKISRGSPMISHLFFVDGLILFEEAKMRQTKVMEDILRSFCNESRQKVSVEKSKLLCLKLSKEA